MIYTSYDYISKYSDTLAEIIALAKLDKYSFEYIESILSSSKMINEFEYSDITLIAFTSSSRLYRSLFPDAKASINDIALFDSSYWIGETYIRIFLKYKLTFEAIFTYLPLEIMERQYALYHEMDEGQFDEYFESLLKENILSKIMSKKSITSVLLAKKTGISLSTIRSLKEGKRDIHKISADKLEKIATALNIKLRTLLYPITLDIVNN